LSQRSGQSIELLPAETKDPQVCRQQEPTPRKKGTVTGVRDRSEVEAMIQRYLELAHSALKDDGIMPLNEEEICA
jgi:hypothetical protein